MRLSITGFAWTTHNSVEEGTAKVRLAMTGLPLDEAKKPHSRHTRSQSMQGRDSKSSASLWTTNHLFSQADSALQAPKPSSDSPVRRGSSRMRTIDSPLIFNSGESFHDVISSSGRCRPFGIFTSGFSDLLSCVMPRVSSESTGWTKSRAKALLELSKRQQSALVNQQDAIDMLEFKLRKLQAIDAKGIASETSNSSAAHSPQYCAIKIIDDTSSESSGTSLSSNCSSMDSSDGSMTTFATAEPPLADLCRDAKKSFSEDSWKVEEKRDSLYMPGFKNMTMNDRVPVFEMACTRARVAVRYFCKVFMMQMEYSGYSVCRTLASIDASAKFMKREHTSFALEANINKALYHCFENDSFDDTGLTLIIDPKERCAARFEEFQRLRLVDSVDAANTAHADFEPNFLAFCEQKMREIWFLFPWNIVFRDTEGRKQFTGAFLDAAKCIWLLHRLASSLYPAATILRVGKGMEINCHYVESLSCSETICTKCEKAKVQFMVAPGFQVHQKVIKCQIYEHLLCD